MNNIMMGGFSSIQQAVGAIQSDNNHESSGTSSVSFQDIFLQKKDEVKFSKHADARLKQRDIQLTDEQMSRLNEGTQKAGSKGIKESLVILDNLAFIVNTENRTVVTAMDAAASDENIYTNIDGAVII